MRYFQVSNSAGQVVFQLPLSSSGQFERMLERLDTDRNIGVKSFALGVTSLDEVFVKVGENRVIRTEAAAGTADDGEVRIGASGGAPVSGGTAGGLGEESTGGFLIDRARPMTGILVGWSLWLMHFRACFLKRWRAGLRNKRMIVFVVVNPLLMLFAGFWLGTAPSRSSFPSFDFADKLFINPPDTPRHLGPTYVWAPPAADPIVASTDFGTSPALGRAPTLNVSDSCWDSSMASSCPNQRDYGAMYRFLSDEALKTDIPSYWGSIMYTPMFKPTPTHKWTHTHTHTLIHTFAQMRTHTHMHSQSLSIQCPHMHTI